MKVVILSTESPHHTYFINKISEQFNVAAVFYETKHVTPKFAISPFFDEEETDFEKRYFFKRFPIRLMTLCPCITCKL